PGVPTFQLGRDKARCLAVRFLIPRLALCMRFSPHTAQHLWSFSMDIHETSVPISPALQLSLSRLNHGLYGGRRTRHEGGHSRGLAPDRGRPPSIGNFGL